MTTRGDVLAGAAPEPDADATAQAVLDERARVLARPVLDEAGPGDEVVVLGFTVAGRDHALEIGAIREILGRSDVSRLPWAPPAVAGVMNIRGEVVLVADAGRLLGVGETAAGSPVVVLDAGGSVLALRVDAVGDVTRVALSELVPVEGDAGATAGSHLVSALTASTLVVDIRALIDEIRLTFGPQEDT